jgi:hypothetical protein
MGAHGRACSPSNSLPICVKPPVIREMSSAGAPPLGVPQNVRQWPSIVRGFLLLEPVRDVGCRVPKMVDDPSPPGIRRSDCTFGMDQDRSDSRSTGGGQGSSPASNSGSGSGNWSWRAPRSRLRTRLRRLRRRSHRDVRGTRRWPRRRCRASSLPGSSPRSDRGVGLAHACARRRMDALSTDTDHLRRDAGRRASASDVSSMVRRSVRLVCCSSLAISNW